MIDEIGDMQLMRSRFDSVPEIGIAMIDQPMFLGWLKKSQDKDLFQQILENGQERIEGKIVHMKLFE